MRDYAWLALACLLEVTKGTGHYLEGGWVTNFHARKNGGVT